MDGGGRGGIRGGEGEETHTHILVASTQITHTLPNAQPARPLPSYLLLWSEKVAAALRVALGAYGGWIQAMSEGNEADVEEMLGALTVALPRAFCEATSKVGGG